MGQPPPEGVVQDRWGDRYVVLVLEPDAAESVALMFGQGDAAYAEIMAWVDEARRRDDDDL